MNLEKRILLSAALAAGLSGYSAIVYAQPGPQTRQDSASYGIPVVEFERVLIRGVDSPNDDDISNWKDKFAIVHPSKGNALYDLMRARAEMLGIPAARMTSKEVADMRKTKVKVNDLYAHSWGTDVAYNGIIAGDIDPQGKIVLINPPSARLSEWMELSKSKGLKVEIYFGDKDFVQNIGDNPVVPGGMSIAAKILTLSIIEGGEGKYGNVTAKKYSGMHDLKTALADLEKKGEFFLLPSDRIRQAKQRETELEAEILAAAKKVNNNGYAIGIETPVSTIPGRYDKPVCFEPVIPPSKNAGSRFAIMNYDEIEKAHQQLAETKRDKEPRPSDNTDKVKEAERRINRVIKLP